MLSKHSILSNSVGSGVYPCAGSQRILPRLTTWTLIIWFQMTSIGWVLAQELPTLGAPRRNLQDLRLPPLPRRNSPVRFAARVDDRDLVLFAADSFEAPVPLTWQVREVAFGRDVRMVLSPSRFEGSRLPEDCIWVSYTVDPIMRGKPLDELLRQRTEAHSLEVIGGAKFRQTTISGFPAMLTEVSERRARTVMETGHMLVATDWCLFELHWMFPQASAIQRRDLVQAWLGEVTLKRPAPRHQNLPPQIAAASAVVGSWKSFRSRLRFYDDGRVVILMDPRRSVRVDDQESGAPERFVGTYHGQGDLVYVVWDDGSKLNFRWRVDGDRLLLTDHEGQVSQLRRLLE